MTPLVPVCWVLVAKSVGGVDAFEGMFPGNLAVGRIFTLESLATAIYVIKTLHCFKLQCLSGKMYHVKDCSVEPDMFVTLKRVAYTPFYLFKR